MKAIILAAGYGTALYPYTKDTPQALLPIRGRPVIEYIIDKISTLDCIDEIILISNHRFLHHFQTWQQACTSHIPVRLFDNGVSIIKDARGATRDLAFVLEEARIDDDVLVIGADNVFSFNLSSFIKAATTHKPAASIVVHPIESGVKAKRFGVVTLDTNMHVCDFEEKPSKINGHRNVSMCIYFIPREKLPSIYEFLSATNNGVMIGNYIQWLVRREQVFGFPAEGAWIDIADTDSYTEAICSF